MECRLPLTNDGSVDSGLNPEFMVGIEVFLDFAYSNQSNVVDEKILCPCQLCGLRKRGPRDGVCVHLMKRGFMNGYVTWFRHGERDVIPFGMPRMPSPPRMASPPRDPYVAMVMDAAGPTFGWGDHLESMREPEPPNPEAMQFYDLLKNAEQPLYEGCSKSRLSAVVDFLIIKSKAGIA